MTPSTPTQPCPRRRALPVLPGSTRFETLRAPLAAFCCGRGIKGTLLLAHEGINGTVAGSDEAIAALIAYLEAIAGTGRPRGQVQPRRRDAVPPHEGAAEARDRHHGRRGHRPARRAPAPMSTPQDWNALISRSRHDRHRHAQRLRGLDRHLPGRGRSRRPRAFANFPPGSKRTATSSTAARSRCSAPAAFAARRRPPM